MNHEYTNPELVFQHCSADRVSQRQVDCEIAAQVMSMLLVVRGSRSAGICDPSNRSAARKVLDDGTL